MKSLLLVNHSFPLELKDNSLLIKDGVSAHSVGVARQLKKKYNVTIFSPGDESKFSFQGIEFIHSGGQSNSQYKFGNLDFCYKLIDYSLNNNFHYIVVHSGLIIFLSFMRNIMKAHCVGYVHDVFPNIKGSIYSFLRDLFFRKSRKLDLVMSDNAYNCEVLTEKYRYNPHKVYLSGNGVEIEKFTFQDSKDEQLVFIGRFVGSKNIIKLIKSLEKLLRQNKNLILVLIGDGILYDDINEYAVKNSLQNSVKIFRNIKEEQKINELQKAKVYVSLSEAEGFGIPLVESMACGAVPVVSNIDAHRFVLQGRDAGFLVNSEEELAEKVEHLLKNEPRRKEMAGKGRRLVEEMWTWEKVASRYEKAFSTLEEKKLSRFQKKVSRPVKLFLIKSTIRLVHYLLFRLRVLRPYNDGV